LTITGLDVKDINGLRVFKGTFMTFVSGDSDHEMAFYSTIKKLFTVLGVEML
jgi:hypothetical protein